MSDSVKLIGADTVADAAQRMYWAAERFELAMREHAERMEAVAERIEKAFAPKQAMCNKCKQHPEMPAHPCPYRVTCSGDTVTLCNCCDDCQGDCSAEIPA